MTYIREHYHKRNHFYFRYRLTNLHTSQSYLCGSIQDMATILGVKRCLVQAVVKYPKLTRKKKRFSKYIDWSMWKIKSFKIPIVNVEYTKNIKKNHYRIKMMRTYNRVLKELVAIKQS